MDSFISRRSHDAIVASKDESIALLKQQLQDQQASFASERATLQALATAAVEAMKPPPVPERFRRPRPETAETREPETLDLTMVDPSDNEALKLIVNRELPTGQKVSGVAYIRAVEHLRSQVIEAHAQRSATASKPAYVRAVPQHITDKIAEAERAGAAAAVGV